ncbi:MAG: mechanosensitive ion channel [Longimicrobiales bacterium]|nr:mechanosensitive ion channel [Longimicrobiales bacterium]
MSFIQNTSNADLGAAAAAGQQIVEDTAGGVVAQIQRVLEIEVPILSALMPGDSAVDVGNVVSFSVILLMTLTLSRVVQLVIGKTMRRRGLSDVGTVGTTQRLVHYALVVIGFGVAVENLGVDLTTLFAAGAVVAVGFGFAMQNILQNFVSGFILLIERSVQPGDTIEVDGAVVKVQEMGVRTTIVRNWDDEEIIIPNSTLVQGNVKNYTLRDDLHRLRSRVGVAYGSDMDRTREVLLEAAAGVEFRNRVKDPVVLLLEFGDSSVVFDVSVWTNDPWTSRINRSHLNFAVWHALKAAGITIAFPQLDVHFDRVEVDASQGESGSDAGPG